MALNSPTHGLIPSLEGPLTSRPTPRDIVRKYRAKISPHLAGLIKKSPAVAKQFVPDERELVDYGTEMPFEEGKNNKGVYGLERIYEDRAVITPYFECGAYCRYCFKKTRTLAGEAKRMSEQDIENAMRVIRMDPRIRTVLITGGDPLMDIPLLTHVLDRIIEIPHVQFIRVGTRNILFNPQNITEELAEKLGSYNRVNFEDLGKSLNLSIGFSLNHADEISPEVARAAQRLIRAGLTVRGQITLLKGINDNAAAIRDLLIRFGNVGIVPYYLFHCMPVVGSMHFRTSVKRGLDIMRNISPLTGSMAPHYVYVTPIGKHRVNATLESSYVEIDGKRYIRATTPYKAADFFEYSGKRALPPLHSVDENGYVVSHYQDGDDN